MIDFRIFQLAAGIIFGVETGVKLSIHQCLINGEHARTRKEYTSAIPWLELVISKLETNEINDINVQLADVQHELNMAISSVC